MGSEESFTGLTVPGPFASAFVPIRSGIYFVDTSNGSDHMEFYDFQSKSTRTVFSPERRVLPWVGGLALSPDQKWLLYSQIDRVESDLEMIEHFR
jgi:hypothetical protein